MKTAYEDFWPNFVNDVRNQKGEWYFGEYLPSKYDLSITSRSPDKLIFSVFGENHKNSKYNNSKKIFYSAENQSRNFPRFELADYTISHHIPGEGSYGEAIEEKTHLRMPIYLRVFGPDRMKNLKSDFDVEREFDKKSRFCCLVTRHEASQVRGETFHAINENYKRVDSAGNGWNNMENGWTVPGEWLNLKDFASNYKFMLAAENRKVMGYCSEKLYNALRCKTVPIYWGNPEVNNLFNSESFINVDNYDSYEELVEYIKYLDNNDDAYKETLNAEPFPCQVNEHPVYNKEQIEEKTEKIFESDS